MSIKKITSIIIALLLTSCANDAGKSINLFGKDSYDEFNIVSNAPLSMPPNFELDEVEGNYHKANDHSSLLGKNLNRELSKGEKLLSEKIKSDKNDIKTITYKRTNIVNDKGFFRKIFKAKNSYSKDSTQNPEADESSRTYNQNKSMQFMKKESVNNKKVCDIKNGEIIYCDKNTFTKNFSFPTP